MSLYRITLHDRASGDEMADISAICTKRHYHLSRNRTGLIDLELDLFKAEDMAAELGMGFFGLFASGMVEVRVTRDGTAKIGGRLMSVVPMLSDTGGTLSLTALDYLELFADRFLAPDDTLSYANLDIGQIAWNRIDATQNKDDGDLGITQGEIDTSRSIVEEEQAAFGKSVKELLIGYTELSDAGDFEFTPDRQFHWHHPGIGVDRPDQPFRYGDGGNIKTIRAPRDASRLVNVSINRGANNGNQQIFAIRQDTSSRASYGRHERVDDYSSIQQTELLEGFGDEALRTNSSPMVVPTIELYGDREPRLSTFGLGDRVPLEIPNRPSFAHVHGQHLRINEIDVVIDDLDHEGIKVEASIA